MPQLTPSQLQSAYHQGNLNVLLSQMSLEQKGLWHQEIVRWGLEQVLPGLTTPEEKELGVMIQEWLAAPSEELAGRLVEQAFASGLFSLPPDLYFTPPDNTHRVLVAIPRDLSGIQLKNLLVAINPLSLDEAGREIVTLLGSAAELPDDPEDMSAAFDAAWNVVKRRELDAAWAILNGGSPAEASPADDDEDYRTGNLKALLGRMSTEQAERFRLALFGQLLARIPPAPPQLDDEVRAAFQGCMDAARRWQQAPNPEQAQALRNALIALEDVIPPPQTPVLSALSLLRDLEGSVRKHMAQVALRVGQALVMTATDDLEEAARAAVELDASLFEPGDDENNRELYDEDAGADPADMLAHPDRQQLAWWQVEAAWALLNDEALPPLSAE